jgi:hypothetical protein
MSALFKIRGPARKPAESIAAGARKILGGSGIGNRFGDGTILHGDTRSSTGRFFGEGEFIKLIAPLAVSCATRTVRVANPQGR